MPAIDAGFFVTERLSQPGLGPLTDGGDPPSPESGEMVCDRLCDKQMCHRIGRNRANDPDTAFAARSAAASPGPSRDYPGIPVTRCAREVYACPCLLQSYSQVVRTHGATPRMMAISTNRTSRDISAHRRSRSLVNAQYGPEPCSAAFSAPDLIRKRAISFSRTIRDRGRSIWSTGR